VVLGAVVGLGLMACRAPEPTVAVEVPATDPPMMAVALGSPPSGDETVKPKPEPKGYKVAVTKVSVAEAEDGNGKTIPAGDARALDLTGPAFPVRALDPVLHIGALHFHAYSYPDRGVLRFVVADVRFLPTEAEVYLQYGDDVHSRIVIARSLGAVK